MIQAPSDPQLLRLAVQNLACAPQAQRRYVQLGWMARALDNLDRVGADVDKLVADGELKTEQAQLIRELREEVARQVSNHEDFIEEADSGPREYLFGNALENEDWERIRQLARRGHTLLMGEGSVFIALMAK
jgi:polyhydroxyalkanoate synthesis regulator phasin